MKDILYKHDKVRMTTLYVLHVNHYCNHQKEIAGVYTSNDKAKEAAQILVDKYDYWQNNFWCDGTKREVPYDRTADIINWDNYEDQQTFKITEFIIDNVDFNPAAFFDIF